VAAWKDPLWTYRVMYQAYGMAGLVRSVTKGWGWLSSLYKGPIQKLQEVPRSPLLMIPPPVSPAQVAAAGRLQAV
jgi:hypothetical protein